MSATPATPAPAPAPGGNIAAIATAITESPGMVAMRGQVDALAIMLAECLTKLTALESQMAGASLTTKRSVNTGAVAAGGVAGAAGAVTVSKYDKKNAGTVAPILFDMDYSGVYSKWAAVPGLLDAAKLDASYLKDLKAGEKEYAHPDRAAFAKWLKRIKKFTETDTAEFKAALTALRDAEAAAGAAPPLAETPAE
jgi:hypothetical protein